MLAGVAAIPDLWAPDIGDYVASSVIRDEFVSPQMSLLNYVWTAKDLGLNVAGGAGGSVDVPYNENTWTVGSLTGYSVRQIIKPLIGGRRLLRVTIYNSYTIDHLSMQIQGSGGQQYYTEYPPIEISFFGGRSGLPGVDGPTPPVDLFTPYFRPYYPTAQSDWILLPQNLLPTDALIIIADMASVQKTGAGLYLASMTAGSGCDQWVASATHSWNQYAPAGTWSKTADIVSMVPRIESR